MKQKKCEDKRKCFAKDNDGMCTILKEVYSKSKCPFCKEKRTDKTKHLTNQDKIRIISKYLEKDFDSVDELKKVIRNIIF